MSTDALRIEHENIQRAVQESRRQSVVAGDTAFVRTMQKVMDDYREARAAGLTKEQAVPGIEAVLRSVWPKRATKFPPTCDACEDTGYMEHTCWAQQRCERPFCNTAHPGHEHQYVTPCSCPKGDGPGGRTRKAQLDEIGEAMKVRPRKRSGFSRFGGGA